MSCGLKDHDMDPNIWDISFVNSNKANERFEIELTGSNKSQIDAPKTITLMIVFISELVIALHSQV